MATDHVPGISADRAERELLAGKAPRNTVLVAVIDGGIDTANTDLVRDLWTNPHPGDGGYVGDVHGWDFIGGAGGDVHWDTYELTRVAVRCQHQATDSSNPLPQSIETRCPQIDSSFARRRADSQEELERVGEIRAALNRATTLLERATGGDSLTLTRVEAIVARDSATGWARGLYLALASRGLTAAALNEAGTQIGSDLEHGLNPTFNPRTVVGDHYRDVSETHYGNADIMGPDAEHGTHVSGIIGATRDDSGGVDGIAPAVRIMMVRAIPDGDERDKDVANAIRFAVDHGARVINMSFGKPFSPEKPAVDAAVRYADGHGVLMVHAAGNDGVNEDDSLSYPSPRYLDGGHAENWIEVGASTWRGGDSLAASFTNYSHDLVDVFAPGVDILSTVPGNHFERESGTSMAAPVVTGLAALLLAYYPSLTVSDVKRIILASATRYTDQMVIRPGSSDDRVPFGSLSVTGGIVNAYAAVQMAEQETGNNK
jgi:subtilisin family serine protease